MALVVLCNCGSEQEAARIARAVVEARLAACVNISAPVRSVYRWQGALEEATEWTLVMKTRNELFDALAAEVRRLHSYEVPEIIALPVAHGLPSYLDWIRAETG